MYSLNDKKSAIRDVQKFLLVIGQDGSIPHLSVDGIYTDETENAVKAFQRLHSLKSDGKIERDTFDLIYSEYLRVKNSSVSYGIKPSSAAFPMNVGDSGNDVAILNALLRGLSHFYLDIPSPLGDFYSRSTESAVRLMQRYLRKEETGETDEELFSTMSKELELNQKNKNA